MPLQVKEENDFKYVDEGKGEVLMLFLILVLGIVLVVHIQLS
jgi:hypothetical protein